MQIITNTHPPGRKRRESEIPNCTLKFTRYNYNDNNNNIYMKSEILQVINLN